MLLCSGTAKYVASLFVVAEFLMFSIKLPLFSLGAWTLLSPLVELLAIERCLPGVLASLEEVIVLSFCGEVFCKPLFNRLRSLLSGPLSFRLSYLACLLSYTANWAFKLRTSSWKYKNTFCKTGSRGVVRRYKSQHVEKIIIFIKLGVTIVRKCCLTRNLSGINARAGNLEI